MNKILKVILIIFFVVTLCILTGVIRVIIVVDSADHSLISGALVENRACPNLGGVINESNFSTFRGIAVFRPFIYTCSIKVKKEGYHTNGSNLLSNLTGFFGLKIVTLNRIQNPQSLLKIERTFLPDTGIDVLSYINNPNNDLPLVTPVNEDKNDFTIISTGKGFSPYVLNGKTEYAENGEPIYKIRFNREGGVQTISKKDEGYQGALDSYYYSLENLFIAPDSGYIQELELLNDRGYVARLSDGKHYMVFRMMGPKMVAYIQPTESKNLESIDKGLKY